MSVRSNVFQKLRESFFDALWFLESRLPDAVLILLAVFIPIALAAFHETVTLRPPEPNEYCVGLVAANGNNGWTGIACFSADFVAQWYDNLIELPSLVSADCQTMSDEAEKKRCEDVNGLIVSHSAAAITGFAVGSGMMFGR